MTLAVLIGVFARDVAAATHILLPIPPRVSLSPPFCELYVTAQVRNRNSVSHCEQKAASALCSTSKQVWQQEPCCGDRKRHLVPGWCERRKCFVTARQLWPVCSLISSF
uniref:Putative secreted protein n=1 Tax=Amblyomma cajennense TaxID=34607 RepID=A0A023FCF8_AMBCJ